MLLIIFLGLMVNSALVSGACDLGPPKLDNFKWSKLADDRPWYHLLQNYTTIDSNLDCPAGRAKPPKCDVSLITNIVYNISAQNYVKYQGFVRNWKKTGYFEIIHQLPSFTGPFLVLAIDYDRYFIVKHCPLDSDELTVYVAFRSPRPDIVTWLRVLKKLLENKIDIRQLGKWPTNHCKWAVSSTEGGSSA